jgi:hypothetical protein
MPYGYSENEGGCGGPLSVLTLVDPACPENASRAVTFDVPSDCCSAEIAVGESLYDGLRLPMLVDSIAIKPQCCGCGSTLTIAPPCDCGQFAVIARGDPCGMAGLAMAMPLRLVCDGYDPCGFCSSLDISITPQDYACADTMWAEFGGTFCVNGNCTPLPVHFCTPVMLECCATFYECVEFQDGVTFESCVSAYSCVDFYGVVSFRAGGPCVTIGDCGIWIGGCTHIDSSSITIGSAGTGLSDTALTLGESGGNCAVRGGQIKYTDGDLYVSVPTGGGGFAWKKIARDA